MHQPLPTLRGTRRHHAPAATCCRGGAPVFVDNRWGESVWNYAFTSDGSEGATAGTQVLAVRPVHSQLPTTHPKNVLLLCCCQAGADLNRGVEHAAVRLCVHLTHIVLEERLVKS